MLPCFTMVLPNLLYLYTLFKVCEMWRRKQTYRSVMTLMDNYDRDGGFHRKLFWYLNILHTKLGCLITISITYRIIWTHSSIGLKKLNLTLRLFIFDPNRTQKNHFYKTKVKMFLRVLKLHIKQFLVKNKPIFINPDGNSLPTYVRSASSFHPSSQLSCLINS